MAELEAKSKVGIDDELDEDGSALESLLQNPVKISRTDDEDTLVDVHVNNPLKKITKLLEEIKKQKAFSFSIRGSLGLAGIALVITSFGIFGGSQAFCSRGTQTFIGTFSVLKIPEIDESPVPYLDQIRDILWKRDKTPTNRMILVRSDTSVLHIKKLAKEDAKKFLQKKVYVTGDYDTCTQTISLIDPLSIEVHP